MLGLFCTASYGVHGHRLSSLNPNGHQWPDPRGGGWRSVARVTSATAVEMDASRKQDPKMGIGERENSEGLDAFTTLLIPEGTSISRGKRRRTRLGRPGQGQGHAS